MIHVQVCLIETLFRRFLHHLDDLRTPYYMCVYKYDLKQREGYVKVLWASKSHGNQVFYKQFLTTLAHIMSL